MTRYNRYNELMAELKNLRSVYIAEGCRWAAMEGDVAARMAREAFIVAATCDAAIGGNKTIGERVRDMLEWAAG